MLSLSLDREAYEAQREELNERLLKAEHELYIARIPAVICYEGWDAGGKGGNIKRLTLGLDPRGYEVVPIAAPTQEEKAHHYLWRFWRCIPKAGHITIFDRTWYGRVLVERVEGFCSEADWKRAYDEINQFERQLADFGAVIVKFWLQIDAEEQLRRFQERQNSPYKQWKITDEDWRNREKRPAYEPAVDEMLRRTSTPHAPLDDPGGQLQVLCADQGPAHRGRGLGKGGRAGRTRRVREAKPLRNGALRTETITLGYVCPRKTRSRNRHFAGIRAPRTLRCLATMAVI